MVRYGSKIVGRIGNIALGSYQTGSIAVSLYDKHVVQGESWDWDSTVQLFSAGLFATTTVVSAKGLKDDLSHYGSVKNEIQTSLRDNNTRNSLSSRDNYIPRDENGNMIPLKRQMVNGRDIPLPDPAAQGRPHTVLGGATSTKTGVEYRQSATFRGGTWPSANGYDVPLYETHWYNHGRGDHANPHKHIFYYDSSDGGWQQGEHSMFWKK